MVLLVSGILKLISKFDELTKIKKQLLLPGSQPSVILVF
jgi:hypothetical protein